MTFLCIAFFVLILGWRISVVIKSFLETERARREELAYFIAKELDRIDEAIRDSKNVKVSAGIFTDDIWKMRN